MGRISINGFPKWTSCGKYIRTVMATFGGTIFLGGSLLMASRNGQAVESGKFSVPPVVTF